MTALEPQAYVLIVALALMGGAIAWAGDAIGYRLGKMRVSLFGLRPRVTATVIGMVSGVLVSVLTIAVLAVTQENVRTFLFEFQEIREQREKTEAKLQEAQKAWAEVNEEAGQAREQARQLTANVKELTGQNAAQAQRNQKLQNQSDGLGREVKGARRQVEVNRRQLAATRSELEITEAELDSKEDLLERIHEKLEQELSAYDESAFASATALPAYIVNQLVATRIVESGRPQKAIAADLLKLLFAASDAAEKRAAEIGENGRAVRVRRLEVDEEKKRIVLVEEKERLQDVSEWLAEQPPSDYVVGVYAAKNIFPSTQGIVDLAWTPNELIRRRGDVVLSIPVDGTLPDAQVYELVRDIVKRRLRVVAQDAGVLPQPGTGDYGLFDLGELFEVTQLLHQRGATVMVRAVATEDCWTTGPLKIALELGPQVAP